MSTDEPHYTIPTITPDDDGIRPDGPPDACFYCRWKVGEPHDEACVVVRKRVRVRFAICLDVAVPFDATKASIEFLYNESTWCANNVIDLIAQEIERRGANGTCLCDALTAEFVEVVDARPFVPVRPPAPPEWYI